MIYDNGRHSSQFIEWCLQAITVIHEYYKIQVIADDAHEEQVTASKYDARNDNDNDTDNNNNNNNLIKCTCCIMTSLIANMY